MIKNEISRSESLADSFLTQIQLHLTEYITNDKIMDSFIQTNTILCFLLNIYARGNEFCGTLAQKRCLFGLCVWV